LKLPAITLIIVCGSLLAVWGTGLGVLFLGQIFFLGQTSQKDENTA